MYVYDKLKKYSYIAYVFMIIFIICFFMWKKTLLIFCAMIVHLIASLFRCLALYQLLRIEECIEEMIHTFLLLLLFICIIIYLLL